MGGTRSLSGIAARADQAFWLAWSEALRDVGDNAYGVEIHRFGRVTALFSHGAPIPFFNRVVGATSGDVAVIEDVVRFYRERQTPMRFDVTRRNRPGVLDRRLKQRGMQVVQHQSNLCMRLDGPSRSDATNVEVEEIGAERAAEFAALYDSAYGMVGGGRVLARFRRDAIMARFGRPGWRFYLASLEGRPVAGAILYLEGSVATLAGGATLVEARGRGCQRALLDRRLADARESGCFHAVSRCIEGSASHRNLLRAGLTEAFTRSVWELPEGAWAQGSRRGRSVITAA